MRWKRIQWAVSLALLSAACGGGGTGDLAWFDQSKASKSLQPSGDIYGESGGRRYRLGVPPQWNQVTPLPVVLWFAGSDSFRGYYGWEIEHNSWPSSCAQLGCISISFETAENNDYWDISEWHDTGDDALVERVLADVELHYPVSAVYASGISSGGKYAFWYTLHHPYVEAVASYEGVIHQPDKPELDSQETELRAELAANPRKFPALYIIGGDSHRDVYHDSLESVEILRSEGYTVQQIFTVRADGTVDTSQGHNWHNPSEGLIFAFFQESSGAAAAAH